MPDDNSSRTAIIVAVISLAGALGVAIINKVPWLQDGGQFEEGSPPPRLNSPPPERPEQSFTTDGWSIIGKARAGKFYDMRIDTGDEPPAIGKTYTASGRFRLIQKGPTEDRKGQVITLGVVNAGESVEVLDLYVPTPSDQEVLVHAKLRAVVHPPKGLSRNN